MSKELQEYVAENECLKHELKRVIEECEKANIAKENLQKIVEELERQKHYHLGQIEAYRFALKVGAE